MRIFFLTYSHEPAIRPEVGGFRKLWELAAALARRGHEPTVFYPRLPGFAPLTPVPSMPYSVLDLRGLRPLTAYLGMLWRAWREGRRRPPSVIYFRSGLNVLPPILGRALGARVLVEINADVLEFLAGEGAGALTRRLFRWSEGLNVRQSDVTVAITPGLRRLVIERYGADPAKVWMIPSGTDAAHFVPEDRTIARRRIGMGPDPVVVGFIGLFYRHQGVPTLLEAVARCLSAVPTLCLLIVGDGVMRSVWEDLARRLGLSAVTRFVGQVPYAEAPTFLNAMDVVVAPFTRDRGETSPFKVLDALACERPVVASDIPSVRSLAEESGALVLVPPEDPAALAVALSALLAEPARRAALGRRGREFVLARHDWQRIGDRLAHELNGAGTEATR